ncbi:MAG: L,D-transpeptidase [Myxococcales bacterium]|nr:L,D-transpeptidase [Myxococcales bacterium]MCB9628634.1 L,D-transpeptidase [Sandaracinaceae bacterium]
MKVARAFTKAALLGLALLLGSWAVLGWGPVELAEAQPREPVSIPLPAWVRSVEVLNDGARVFRGPSEASGRRGTIARGTRLRVLRRLSGVDCPTGYWFQVGEELYLCTRHAQLSAELPTGVPQPVVPEGAILPKAYAFVRTDGARAYARTSDYFTDEYAMALGQGFGVVVTGERVTQGVRFVRTENQLYIERGDIGFARGSDHQGVELGPDDDLHFAWVRRDNATVHARPNGPVLRRVGRRTRLRLDPDAPARSGWLTLADGGAMRTRDLQRPLLSAPPAEVRPGERWLDVSVAEQVLVAYEGERPLFVTLVSTGREGPHHRTPLGVHAIWIKLAYSDMSNLGVDAPSEYAIEDVPWVQYFEGSNGLHAAFWHDDFGHARSHGCVNLSPRDARYLFDFTQPALPAGWNAILPLESERPSYIRVRP